MRYQDGLTVIEALIVLAIVGVLLALGLPSLSDLVEDQQFYLRHSAPGLLD
jgi:prepilin-type N-terminal cleavage/methylation domain-containing protein